MLWNNKVVTNFEVVRRGDEFFQEWAHVKEKHNSSTNKDNISNSDSWEPPKPRTLKCNVDASFR